MSSHSEGKFKIIQDEKEQAGLLTPKIVTEKLSLPQKKRSLLRVAAPQFLAAIGFGFMVASVAAICVLPTVVIGSLHNVTDAEFELSDYEVSWYGSLSYFVQPVASIISGFTQNIFGRRRMMLTATIPLFAGWVFLFFANSVNTLYITQIIFGLSIGFMESPSMSYLGEAMQPRFRGTLSSLAEMLYIFGTLYLFFCGSFLHWRTVSICGAVLPCITFSIVLMLPESPTWLIVKGRFDDAEKSLMWLRGWVTSEEVKEEMQALTKVVSDNPYSGAKIIDGEYTRVKNTPSQLALLKEKRIFKPVILVSLFFFAGNAGSLLGMRPLFVEIFKKMQLSPLLLVGSSVINGFGGFVCVLIVHRTGKRFISIGSLLILTVTCLALGGYVAADLTIPWLATLIFVVNFFAAGLGILTMPWALVSEIFPLEARGLSAGMCAAGCYVSYFFFSKTYIALNNLVAMPGVLLVYGAVSLAGATYLYVCLPETEGKTLNEIEEAFQK